MKEQLLKETQASLLPKMKDLGLSSSQILLRRIIQEENTENKTLYCEIEAFFDDVCVKSTASAKDGKVIVFDVEAVPLFNGELEDYDTEIIAPTHQASQSTQPQVESSQPLDTNQDQPSHA